MSLVEFGNILKFIRGGEPTPEEKKQLFKEAALMALARATSADTNIQHVEVKAVQQILKMVTGEEISVADIRVAAASDLFEKEPLEKYLSGVGRKLEATDRMTIMHSLAEVVRSDERISHFETDYFDMVANALKATPSEIAGLVPDAQQPIVRPNP
jgi:uncharacterized tellurite resistance protein B-like protein